MHWQWLLFEGRVCDAERMRWVDRPGPHGTVILTLALNKTAEVDLLQNGNGCG